MSTRAVYTFIDISGGREHHVYKHHDGYPKGAAEAISNALPLAWIPPRFEADEFGAAFIAGNKQAGGDLRLTDHYARHGDLEYRYEITMRNNVLWITAYKAYIFGLGPDETNWQKIFEGNLPSFSEWTEKEDA